MADILQNPADVTQLSQFVAEACGIHLGQEKGYLFQARLGSLVAQTGVKDISEFIRRARTDMTGELRDRIVDSMTTHETYWFRDERPWTALEAHLLPSIAGLLRAGRRARILCAACSTGQEPYSLAMLIDRLSQKGKLAGATPSQFEIVATDVSVGTLALAREGRFNQIEIARGLPEDYRSAYFKLSPDNSWILSQTIRDRVTFRKHNLQDDLQPLGVFDLVLCRNVAIYFEEAFRSALFDRLARSLQPGGHLLLGGTESLLSHESLFQRSQLGSAIFYQRK